MALTLGKSCLTAIRGHYRKPCVMSVLYNPAKLEHTLHKDIADATKDDQPLDNMKNPFEPEKPKCILCKHDITPDYKNVRLLSQFQSSYTGRIYGRHITGLCKHKQTQVELEIVKARAVGFMGYYTKDRAFLADPRIFDPENPIRQHKY